MPRRSIAWVLAALLLGCGTTSPLAVERAASEPWEFAFDGRDWRLGYANAAGDQAIREYVLPGERVASWTELVSSQYAAVELAPKALYEQQVSRLGRDCPSLVAAPIDESADSVLFEWRHEGCQGFPAQHELCRVDRGVTGTFSLRFTEKTKRLTPEKRERWLAILRAARLRPAS